MAAYSLLLPGLPNDLAFLCLARIPARQLPRLRHVNFLWKLTIDSIRFYTARRCISPFPSILTIRLINDRYEFLDSDLVDISSPRLLFSCPVDASLNFFPPGATLASVGNFILVMAPGHRVLKFSLATRQWISVSKVMPSWCKLHANTVRGHVGVIGCDAEHYPMVNEGSDLHSTFHPAICEVYDHNNDSWTSTKGLPEDFVCHGLCLSCDGSVFARGSLISDGDSVYELDLAKRTWRENEVVQEKLRGLSHESKVMAVPRGFLAATNIEDNIHVQHQGPSHHDWIDVVTEYCEEPCQFFLCGLMKQVYLVISRAEGTIWRSRPFPYYGGLHILRVPCQKLVMAACICAEI